MPPLDTIFRIALITYGVIGFLVFFGVLVYDFRRDKQSATNFIFGFVTLSIVAFFITIAFWPAVLFFYLLELSVSQNANKEKKPDVKPHR